MHVKFPCSDIILILVATFPHKVPGGYRFLIIGPVIDGLLGGMSTIQATNNAYLSDSTPDGSRAKMFSRLLVRPLIDWRTNAGFSPPRFRF